MLIIAMSLYLGGGCDVTGDAYVNRESTFVWTEKKENKKTIDYKSPIEC